MTGHRFPGPGVRWITLLLSVSSFASASTDLRLVEAVQQRDKEAVHSLVGRRADVNASQPDGATALMWATHWDDIEVAELLIRAGANVNAANEDGATALWLACTNGNAAIAEKLLKAGANPNAALKLGETPLMAAAGKSVEVVELLLAHGAKVNASETRGGQNALMWAAAEKRPDVERVLIEHGADVHARSKGGFTPLLFAAQQGDLESAQILLAAGAKVNNASPDGMTPLLVAAAGDRTELMTLFLEKGADPSAANKDGFTALHYVISGRSAPESVKTLLAHGASPNARLVKNPPDSSSTTTFVGASPLFLAAMARKPVVLQALVAGGADPLLPATETVFLNGSNGRRLQMVAGTSPLMAAAGAGRFKGNYPEFTPEEEKSALEAVKLLLELGADVNAANEYGQTPLHILAYLRADTIIQFLAEKGAKLDAMDNFGQTPLSIAQRVHTISLKDNFDMQPRRFNESTMNLLLKLGAIPLEASGVQPAKEVPQ